jgi:hypothetical protein
MSVQYGDRIEMSQRERDRLKVLHGVQQGLHSEVDPILWTKIGHFFATLSLAFQTTDFSLLLLDGRCFDTVRLAG